jgi:ABC-type antimicrobial peptide transport system permease subunit
LALTLLAVGAAITLALGIVGLYGVIAYVVSLRSREISIRIALGLVPAAAVRMILRQGEAIVVAGAVAGVVVFMVFARLLTTLAFEVSALDPTTLMCSLAVVLLVATLATWLPARRAARVDPARVLSAD